MMKRFAQAWAFASILLLPNYIDLTSGDALVRSPRPMTRIALAQLADIVIVAALFGLIMAGLRRLRWWPQIRWALLALLPVLLLIRNLNVFPFHVPAVAILAGSLLWWGFLAFLVLRARPAAVQVHRAGSALLAAFVIFAAIKTWQIGHAALWHPGPQSYEAAIAPAPATRPRLVWILFDELAYKPVFEDRDPSVDFRNFDRFRGESTLYSDITPIGYKTTRIIAGLQLGREVGSTRYTEDQHYLVQFRGTTEWQRFNTADSLFGIAHQRGLSISIVGWYIAACPIYQGIATECYWSNDDAQNRGPALPGAGFVANTWMPLRVMAEQAFDPRAAWDDQARIFSLGHIASQEDVVGHALATLGTSQADIIYLHLPAPHPPAFWNRRTGRYAAGGSYLDSLAYTDRTLGQILSVLQSQPRWAATTVIVHGDHSWRTHMWRIQPGWSAEDERLSYGGQWDPRPLVMIHVPGEQSGNSVNTPVSLMHVHDVVAAWIRNFHP